ncbi:MAG: ATP-binding protein [Planctomycetota bacterium]|jgi:signal transduction histidine kinase|nr:ATP-binding protein [Planctomycetota bacterium]
MKIHQKYSLSAFVYGSAFLVAICTGYYFIARANALESSIEKYLSLAKENGKDIDIFLVEKSKIARTLASSPVITRALADSNGEFEGFPDDERSRRIEELNEKWKAAKEPGEPFVRAYMANPSADYLRKQQSILPDEYGEIFITNRYGVIIATTGKLTTLAHAHKYWWLAAYSAGEGRTFFDDRGYDESVQGYVLGVVVPIIKDEQIIGILKSNLNVIGGLSLVVKSDDGEDSRTRKIVRSAGRIVYEKGRVPLSSSVPKELLDKMQAVHTGSVLSKENGIDKVFAFAQVPITRGSSEYGFGGRSASANHKQGNVGEGWFIVVAESMDMALASAAETARLILVSGAALILLLALWAWLVGGRMSRPIVRLAEHAKRVGEGDLKAQADVSSSDELGTLADSLNEMASDLHAMIDQYRTAEEEVSRNAAVLEAVNEVLSEALTCETEEELGKICLAVAERLTGSKFGCFVEVNEDGLFDTIAISNPGWDACDMAVEDARRNTVSMPIRGIDRSTIREGKPRIVNEDEIATHADRVGFPEGHPPVRAFLGVPFIHEGKVVGMISLANKEGGYELHDQEAVEALSVAMVEALRTKRADVELAQHREHLEEMVASRTQELARSNAELEQYAYIISHDLQTPLRTCISFAQLLTKHCEGELDAKAEGFIRHIVEGADSMQTLIRDLLAFSRVGSEEEAPERTDCSEAFDLAVANLQADIEESGAVVKQEGLPTLEANRSQMVQLLQNLVSNGIKYRGEKPPEIHVTSKLEEGEWRFAVSDNGIGIPPEHLEAIFAVFRRLHTPQEYPGTGVGLAICKKIVELHGGRIWVESEPGEGSMFCFTFPSKPKARDRVTPD